MPNTRPRKDPYLMAVIVLAIVFVIYWAAFFNYRFSTYQTKYYDAGVQLNSIYEHILYPSELPGLQYLVFGNHISPFSLLITVATAVFGSPYTPFVIQYLALALAGIVAYLVCRDILKSKVAGIAMFVAFLISAGTLGTASFDFHAEAFFPLFVLMAFYMYTTDNRIGFLSFITVTLCLQEAAPAICAALILGLLYYELVYNRGSHGTKALLHNEKMKTLALAVVLTAAFSVFYFLAGRYLISAYSGPYAITPPIMRYLPYIVYQFAAIGNSSAGAAAIYGLTLYFGLVGIAILFFGFGLGGIADPIMTLLFVSPWAYEIFVIHNFGFGVPLYQYYSYVIGGAIISSILGIKLLSDKKSVLKALWGRLISRASPTALGFSTLSMSIVIAMLLFGITYYGSFRVFLLSNVPSGPNFTGVGALLQANIPGNTTVMAAPSITPHLYYVKELELTPNANVQIFTSNGVQNASLSLYWTQPQYIVVDNIYNDLYTMDNANFSVYTYMGDNYTQIAQMHNPNVTIYKLR